MLLYKHLYYCSTPTLQLLYKHLYYCSTTLQLLYKHLSSYSTTTLQLLFSHSPPTLMLLSCPSYPTAPAAANSSPVAFRLGHLTPLLLNVRVIWKP